MKKTDIPIGCHAGEEFHERAWALWKFKAVEQFILCKRRPATHHVTQVRLRKLIMSEIDGCKLCFAEKLCDSGTISCLLRANTYKDMRFTLISDAIVKFCNIAITEQLAEAFK